MLELFGNFLKFTMSTLIMKLTYILFQNNSKESKKKYFQESWLINSEFKKWVGIAVDDQMQAKCNSCKVTFLFGNNAHNPSSKSHATGKGHCKKVKEWKEMHSFFTKRQTVFKSTEKEKDVEKVENIKPKRADIKPKRAETMETPTCLKIGQSTETFHFEMRENFMPRFCGT